MTAAAFLLLLCGVVLNAIAQVLLKAGTNATGVLGGTGAGWAATAGAMATQPYFWLGTACYGVSVIVWILGLSRVPVSIAYPILSIGYVINAMAAWALFGEQVGVLRWTGIAFILIGVWLVARSA